MANFYWWNIECSKKSRTEDLDSYTFIYIYFDIDLCSVESYFLSPSRKKQKKWDSALRKEKD